MHTRFLVIIYNKLKMTKRKIFTTLSVGALIISAPVATFAMVGYKNPTGEGDFHIQHYDSQTTDEEKLNLIKETIDVQIEHANNLLETTELVNDGEKEN